jgi:hypothetical protein
MGRHVIQAEGRRDEHAINITTPHIFPIFKGAPQEIRAGSSSCSIFNPPRPLENIGKLIIYSKYPEVDPQLPIAAEKVEWIRDWDEVLEEDGESQDDR